MPKILNIAVIGAGTMAQAVHLPVLRRRWDRFTVAALVDHSPRRRREASEVWGVEEARRYETVADLIAAVRAKTLSVDAAVLSTDGLHVEDLLQLMRRGIPVLAEPPLGYSAAEISEVADFERMTGRRLVMMAYPQQYDDSVTRMAEHIAVKDLRMVDHEVLMPASQPLFGGAHVTTSSYDLPTETRSARRKALQAAVEAGSGDGATQRDRDLYVKGLLTGLAHQLSVIEGAYGPVARLSAVRHWPKGVIPGSIELLGELEGGAHVRLVWHYLPFAPEYSESIKVLSARRRMRVELPAPSHGDTRSTVSLREKKSGVVQEISTTAPKGAVELMWEEFHAFVDKGKQPVSGAAEALEQVALLREVLSSIVVADGRSLEAPKSDEDEAGGADTADTASTAGASAAATDGSVDADAGADDTAAPQGSGSVSAPRAASAVGAMEVTAPAATTAAPATTTAPASDAVTPDADDTAPADGDSVDADQGGTAPGGSEPAPETLEQPLSVDDATGTPQPAHAGLAAEEVADAWGPALAPTAEAPAADAPVADAPAVGSSAGDAPTAEAPGTDRAAGEDPRS